MLSADERRRRMMFRGLCSLRMAYPGVVDSDEWADRINGYAAKLLHHPDEPLAFAMEHGHRLYRRWFPGAGELDELALVVRQHEQCDILRAFDDRPQTCDELDALACKHRRVRQASTRALPEGRTEADEDAASRGMEMVRKAIAQVSRASETPQGGRFRQT